jgi:hypothetical protein
MTKASRGAWRARRVAGEVGGQGMRAGSVGRTKGRGGGSGASVPRGIDGQAATMGQEFARAAVPCVDPSMHRLTGDPVRSPWLFAARRLPIPPYAAHGTAGRAGSRIDPVACIALTWVAFHLWVASPLPIAWGVLRVGETKG